MVKIGTALGYGSMAVNPLKFGIEMEVEFPQAYDDEIGVDEVVLRATEKLCGESCYWSAGHDGSLRNGMEYKTMGGLSERPLDRALELFYEWLPTSGYRWSQRCSTHVHVNVLDLDIAQLHKFLGCLLMFEDVLFDHVARERTYSNFCAPFYLNTQLLDKIGFNGLRIPPGYGLSRNTYNLVHALTRVWSKYTSINLTRLASLGTVEFRGAHLIESLGEMHRLLGMLGSLKVLSMESPAEEKYFKFVNRIKSMAPGVVFGSGVEPWYTRDAESAITCKANALLISRVNTAVNDERIQDMPVAEQGAMGVTSAGGRGLLGGSHFPQEFISTLRDGTPDWMNVNAVYAAAQEAQEVQEAYLTASREFTH